jgi:hypothetical protein
MRESSLITYNYESLDYTIGTSSTVEFDFMKLWEFKKSLGNLFDPLALDFYHVHPRGFDSYSLMDINCMKGLKQALGFSPPFHIILFKNSEIYNLDYNLLSYRYYTDTDIKRNLENEIGLTKNQLIFLKILSYGG